MIRQLRIIWLRMMMSHSLDCEAAYSKAAAEFRNAASAAILDGRNPAPFQASAALYHRLVLTEQDLQRNYRAQLIGLGARAEMLV